MSPSDALVPASESDPAASLERYARQMRFAPVGEAGQRKLLASRVLICGCGALGSFAATLLTRAGIGKLRIVDRDFLELNNLQRQVLFDEDDVAADLPKAVAAAHKLRRVNSTIEIEPVVADVSAGNVLALCEGIDLIVDGTDNFETRLLLNDVAVKHGLPWIYGGCLGAEGQTMTILPGETACLRCLMPEPPGAGMAPTCDMAGILGPAIGVIASIEAVEAIKILSGHRAAVQRVLTVIDLWDNRLHQVRLDTLRDTADCPCCQRREFPWLEGQRGSGATVLCGRNSVQVSPSSGQRCDLDAMAAKLTAAGRVSRNAFLLRLTLDEHQITLFGDGRAIVAGTDDPATARSLYARYIGN